MTNRTIGENMAICDSKKKQWAALKNWWGSSVRSTTMQRKSATAVITVMETQNPSEIDRAFGIAEAITSSEEFSALECESFSTVHETEKYQTGTWHYVRIRIKF